MVKFIVSLLLIAGLTFSALVFLGYEFHPENFKHYLPGTSGGKSVELVLSDGRKLSGEIVEESADAVSFRLNGVVRRISKMQIQSSKETESNPVIDFIENAKRQHKMNPILVKGKGGLGSENFGDGAPKELPAFSGNE